MVYPNDAEFDRVGQEKYEQISRTGQGGIDTVFQRRDGTLINVHLVSRALDVNDLSQGTIFTALDITDRALYENALVAKTDALERSNEELKQFAYVASHDLQEPLNLIGGHVGLIAETYKGRLTEEADESIGYVLDGVDRMKALIKDLLAYSRVESKGNPFEPTALDAVFEEARSNLGVRIDENAARVTSDPLPTVNVDRSQIVRLLQNLIGNALKFRKPDEPPVIHVACERRGRQWVMSVRDNGIGIPEAGRQKIFVIFQRLHPRHEYQGTGIGLSICKRIIERHGGRIWLESTFGKGSTFFFSLPV